MQIFIKYHQSLWLKRFLPLNPCGQFVIQTLYLPIRVRKHIQFLFFPMPKLYKIAIYMCTFDVHLRPPRAGLGSISFRVAIPKWGVL